MAESTPQEKKEGSTGWLAMKHLICMLMGTVGGMVGGFAGWLLRPGTLLGTAPILGAALGAAILFGFAFKVAGLYDLYYQRFLGKLNVVPRMDRLKALHLASFDLYVTVHRAKNVCLPTAFPERVFAEVQVGRMTDDGVWIPQRNPQKRTCADMKGNFEECFHFVVAPTDDTVKFQIYTQEIMGNVPRGQCFASIMDDVLGQGFPQKTTLSLTVLAGQTEADLEDKFKNPDHLVGSLVVSFAPGANFPSWALSELEERHQVAFQHLRTDQTRLMTKVQGTGQYGTWVAKGAEKDSIR